MAYARETTIVAGSVPFATRFTLYAVSGRGGGPAMFVPFRSNTPP